MWHKEIYDLVAYVQKYSKALIIDCNLFYQPSLETDHNTPKQAGNIICGQNHWWVECYVDPPHKHTKNLFFHAQNSQFHCSLNQTNITMLLYTHVMVFLVMFV